MHFMEAVLGIILAFLCFICGSVILYDCFVDLKSVRLISKRLSVIYASLLFIDGIAIFVGIILNIIDGGGANVCG